MSQLEKIGSLGEKRAILLEIPEGEEINYILGKFTDRMTGMLFFVSEFRYEPMSKLLYPVSSQITEGDKYEIFVHKVKRKL